MAGYIGSKAVLLSTTAAVVTGDADIGGGLTVDTNTLFVDAANNRVGVGTTSPDGNLTVGNTSTSGDVSIRIKGDATSRGFLMFGDAGGAQLGDIMYDHNDNHMRFRVNNSERMRIDSSGNVGIGTSSPTSTLTVLGPNGAAGGLSLTSSTSDATNKIARLKMPHYINAEEPVSLILGSALATTNVVQVGGGSAVENAATDIQFFTAGNNTTTTGTERMRIDSSGNLLVGTTTALGLDGISIQKNGTNPRMLFNKSFAGTSGVINFYYNSGIIGSITTSTTSTAYNTTSDYRLKENVVPLSGAADRLAQIPVHRFNFIAAPDRTVDGFLAHEVQEFVPECVTGEKDQVDDEGNPVYQGIDQSKLVPLLTAALQEALTKINALEARIVTLEGGAA